MNEWGYCTKKKKKDVHDSPCEVSTQQIFINSGQHGDAIHLKGGLVMCGPNCCLNLSG